MGNLVPVEGTPLSDYLDHVHIKENTIKFETQIPVMKRKTLEGSVKVSWQVRFYSSYRNSLKLSELLEPDGGSFLGIKQIPLNCLFYASITMRSLISSMLILFSFIYTHGNNSFRNIWIFLCSLSLVYQVYCVAPYILHSYLQFSLLNDIICFEKNLKLAMQYLRDVSYVAAGYALCEDSPLVRSCISPTYMDAYCTSINDIVNNVNEAYSTYMSRPLETEHNREYESSHLSQLGEMISALKIRRSQILLYTFHQYMKFSFSGSSKEMCELTYRMKYLKKRLQISQSHLAELSKYSRGSKIEQSSSLSPEQKSNLFYINQIKASVYTLQMKLSHMSHQICVDSKKSVRDLSAIRRDIQTMLDLLSYLEHSSKLNAISKDGKTTQSDYVDNDESATVDAPDASMEGISCGPEKARERTLVPNKNNVLRGAIMNELRDVLEIRRPKHE